MNLRKEITEKLLSCKRPGMEELVNDLVHNTDYFTAPASTKFHGCCEGGLAMHHWNVFQLFFEKNKKLNKLTNEEVIIVSLLHDLCKCGAYYKTSEGYSCNRDVLNQGHAKLSLERIKRFIKLTHKEEALIKFHMGTFGIIKQKEYSLEELNRAIIDEPLVQIFAAIDAEESLE